MTGRELELKPVKEGLGKCTETWSERDYEETMNSGVTTLGFFWISEDQKGNEPIGRGVVSPTHDTK